MIQTEVQWPEHRQVFEAPLAEAQERKWGVETNFRRLDANRFTAVVYDGGKAVYRCGIALGGMFGNGIAYWYDDRAELNSSKENLRVKADDQVLILRSLGMSGMRGDETRKPTPEGTAACYWAMLIGHLQDR